ncbi:hypothetical protein N9P28_02960 [Schleiferiaceae bacterium]|nr:hypothetical protein [Schleiferiaceae bacterium]
MKNILIVTSFGFLFAFMPLSLLGQSPISLSQSSTAVPALSFDTKTYAFEKGDVIKFKFDVKSRTMTKVSIVEFPSNYVYSAFKSKGDEVEVAVPRRGVYEFVFENSGVARRIVNYSIVRIPKDESASSFNSTVGYLSVYDTLIKETEQEFVISVDTSFVQVTDQMVRVHSATNLNGNKTVSTFSLPENTVKWSYYIGVDQGGEEAYGAASDELTKSGMALIGSIDPLIGLAITGVSSFAALSKGEDIEYSIVEGNNANLFLQGSAYQGLRRAKVLNDASVMSKVTKRPISFCLINDNALTGVDVLVKVSAICVDRKTEMRIVKEKVITERKVPVIVE